MLYSFIARPRNARPAAAVVAALLILLTAAAPLRPAAAPQVRALSDRSDRKVDLELMIAADISGSMDALEATLQRQAVLAALRDPVVVDAIGRGALGRIALSYMEWAGDRHQSVLVDWREVGDKASADAFADALEAQPIRTELYTSITAALDFAATRFDGNGFDSRRRIIDISGDGPNNRGGAVDSARDRARDAGFIVNGLPIINDRIGRFGMPPLPDLDLYYRKCVIAGPGAFVVVADGFEDFARAIRLKLLLEISQQSPIAPRIVAASDRPGPPCDIGERQLRERYGDD